MSLESIQRWLTYPVASQNASTTADVRFSAALDEMYRLITEIEKNPVANWGALRDDWFKAFAEMKQSFLATQETPTPQNERANHELLISEVSTAVRTWRWPRGGEKPPTHTIHLHGVIGQSEGCFYYRSDVIVIENRAGTQKTSRGVWSGPLPTSEVAVSLIDEAIENYDLFWGPISAQQGIAKSKQQSKKP